MSKEYTQEQIVAQLLNHDYRNLMLAELHNQHLQQDAPPKLAAYFLRRIEHLLEQVDRHDQRSWHDWVSLCSIDYDFGYMGYFDQTLEALKAGVGMRSPTAL